MVKDRTDKSKLTNWIEGDTFALKIKSKKREYNNKYLIFIYEQLKAREQRKTTVTFRVKLSQGTMLPKIEEINNLPYIISAACFPVEEELSTPEVKCLKTDEFGLIYNYIVSIYTGRYYVPKKLQYIGNHNFDKPLNEYIPKYWHRAELFTSWDLVEENLINNYEYYNKKNLRLYTFDGNKIAYERAVSNTNIIKKTIDISPKIYENKNKRLNKETYVGSLDKNSIKIKKV